MTSTTLEGGRSRLTSIDLLRGLVMMLMALDHVRDFVSPGTTPELIEGVGPGLFLTRWVTHFCAPTFVFLAGVSAFLYGRDKSRAVLARFLATRGLWLVLVELTFVFFAWTFLPPLYQVVVLTVIWAIGVSMVVLAGLIWLPRGVIAAIAVGIIVGHNLLNGLSIEAETSEAWRLGLEEQSFRSLTDYPWALVHVQGGFLFAWMFVFVGYPLVPWIGVMAAGYAFGSVMTLEPAQRTRVVFSSGIALTLAFLALRGIDGYGNVRNWAEGESAIDTLIAFFNTEKYPPSLAFVLMTLGPALIVLGLMERARGRIARVLLVFGRVPLFFYVTHIALANLMGGLAFQLHGDSTRWIGALLKGPPTDGKVPGLPEVYVAWILCIVILYVPCRMFADLKRRRRDLWWLSYL